MTRSLQSLVAVLGLVGASVSAGAGAPAPMEDLGPPDATITISGGVIAVGVGYEWARGTLTYQGQTVPFWVRGVSVMDIGAAKIAGVGEVFNLKSLADFEGNYAGTTFGSAISRGASLALIKNEKGVTIRARSTISGVRLNFSGNGMRIRLTAPPK
jgi:outer membrane immunogenic protein